MDRESAKEAIVEQVNVMYDVNRNVYQELNVISLLSFLQGAYGDLKSTKLGAIRLKKYQEILDSEINWDAGVGDDPAEIAKRMNMIENSEAGWNAEVGTKTAEIIKRQALGLSDMQKPTYDESNAETYPAFLGESAELLERVGCGDIKLRIYIELLDEALNEKETAIIAGNRNKADSSFSDISPEASY